MKFYRRTKHGLKIDDKLSGLFSTWNPEDEVWLFIGPHDDDTVIGAGLLLQAGLQENVQVHSLVTSDGRMGYCHENQRDKIIDIRRDETYKSFDILGMPKENIHYGNFPDCNLNAFIGRRKAQAGDPDIVGFTGLQNLFTYYLRKIKPKRVFLPTGQDLHPDHKIVYQELLISLFHASGNIWPELGPILKQVPYVYEFPVYCDLAEPSTIKVIADDDVFNKKLEAILAYQSQEQIAQLVESRRDGGPFEFFLPVSYAFYHPTNYSGLF